MQSSLHLLADYCLVLNPSPKDQSDHLHLLLLGIRDKNAIPYTKELEDPKLKDPEIQDSTQLYPYAPLFLPKDGPEIQTGGMARRR